MNVARCFRKALTLLLSLALLFSGLPVMFVPPPIMQIQLPEVVGSR